MQRDKQLKPLEMQRHILIFKPSCFKIIEPTGTFNLHGGQGGALGQIGGMETKQQPQVPLCVNERGGETAEVWSGDCLLVRL